MMNQPIIFTLLVFIFTSLVQQTTQQKPHIVFILADDLGWNDVGFHGSGAISTPNIDALAYSGVILNNYYVTPICTPSRSALMTGKYPIHTGMQHGVLYGAEPRGLPLVEKILPQYLKELGYVNQIVGKWHLGSFKKEYTPTYRGFLSHIGFWTGHQDYFDHTAVENPGWGFDMRRNMDLAYDLHGKYSTDIFTEEAVELINNHNKTQPLFLYLAHAAVHSGNPYNPQPIFDEMVEEFPKVETYKRKRFAGVLKKLDDSVGAVVKSLKDRNMLENSVIIFSTDNGGPAGGFNLNAASNWPLRGVKNTLWEGGVRGVGVIWSPLLKKTSRSSKQLMHISDWLPTLLHVAKGGQNFETPENIDGHDMWQSLSEDLPSPRTEILHNIDDIFGNAALTVGCWKILSGTTYNGTWDSWYGPSERNSSYDVKQVFKCDAGKAVSLGAKLTTAQVLELRKVSQVECSIPPEQRIECKPLLSDCIFNILQDPCEQQNLAKKYPNMLRVLKQSLLNYNESAILPGNLPLDPRGNPKYWNYTFTNFGDFI